MDILQYKQLTRDGHSLFAAPSAHHQHHPELQFSSCLVRTREEEEEENWGNGLPHPPALLPQTITVTLLEKK